ncbi:sodium-dependent proline transporter-like [Phasianus colchicus]|uniref:sodium-dependent proline transporter-like n=1 Tax=Phasianus colchicus TaxID=9054 RepID=UPI00129E31F6|nr:sodium-dependent proline transporter-like [Phasianus colchicus]
MLLPHPILLILLCSGVILGVCSQFFVPLQVNIFQTQDPITPQPWAEPPAPVGSPAPNPPRDTWAGRHTFLLSCLGYCVGLGNVWRFPYLCYRNGGGVFLIPYFLMLLLVGLPLFLMELSLGQYGAAGPIAVWKCCPILQGVGVGMLVVSSLVSIYYNVIIAWAFYYLGSSFQSPLPWSCDAPRNAELCQNASGSATDASASEAFWNEQVLGVTHSSGLGDPGSVQWLLALCLLAAWLVVFLCMLRGIHSSGKVVYITATFPYLILLILIIRGATLPGSLDGVRFYLSSDWSKLLSAQVWSDAASQIFYSLGIGFGGLLSMASYNKFDNNVVRDTLVIAVGNCCTSFFAGFAIFSVLGHMALKRDIPVGSVAESGPGLAFVAYPEALSLLPGSPFWSILFFLMLFMLGVDTLFGNIEAITTAIMDEFPALREGRRKVMLLAVLCFSFFLLGLLLVTQGGIFWFTLIDTYSTGFGLIIITLLMCIGIASCYGERSWGAPRSRAGGFHGAELGCDVRCTLGSSFSTAHPHVGLLSTILMSWGAQALWVPGTEPCWGGGLAVTPCPTGIERFCRDIVTMICLCPPWYSRVLGCFKVCWVFFTPCLLLFTLIFTFLDMYNIPLSYGTYEFPAWGTSLGVCMGVLSCVQIPIGAIVALCHQTGTLTDRFQKAMQPLHSWGTAAASAEDIIEVPFTITLSSSDFTTPPHSES